MHIFASFKNLGGYDKLHHPQEFDPGVPIVEDINNGDADDKDDKGDNNSALDDLEEIIESSNDDDTDDADKNKDKNKDKTDDEEVIEEESDEDKEKNKGNKDKSDEDKDGDDKESTPTIKAVTKKYPKLFKEFPELRTNYFYGKQMKEHFTSIDEAKEARETVDNFSQIQTEIAQGDPQAVVSFLKESSKDGKGIVKFGREFIKSVEDNPRVVGAILFPTLRSLLIETQKSAKLANNKNLELSVGHLAAHLFGTQDGSIPEDKTAADDNKNNNELTEAQKVLIQKGKEFQEDVLVTAYDEMSNMVEASLAALKSAKPAIKKAIKNDILNAISAQLKNDKAHAKAMQSHWKNAENKGYPLSMRSSIKSGILEAVKLALPGVRANILKENGFIVRKSQSKNNSDNTDVKVTKNKTDNSSSKKTGAMTPEELKKSGKSDAEILDILVK